MRRSNIDQHDKRTGLFWYWVFSPLEDGWYCEVWGRSGRTRYVTEVFPTREQAILEVKRYLRDQPSA